MEDPLDNCLWFLVITLLDGRIHLKERGHALISFCTIILHPSDPHKTLDVLAEIATSILSNEALRFEDWGFFDIPILLRMAMEARNKPRLHIGRYIRIGIKGEREKLAKLDQALLDLPVVKFHYIKQFDKEDFFPVAARHPNQSSFTGFFSYSLEAVQNAEVIEAALLDFLYATGHSNYLFTVRYGRENDPYDRDSIFLADANESNTSDIHNPKMFDKPRQRKNSADKGGKQ